MKLFTLIIAFVISSSLVNAQGWMWVKHFNGTGQNMPTNAIQDAAGNSYVFGNINGAVSQDGISLTTNGQDAFFAKYNSAGQIQWIKQLGGTYTQTAGSIVFSNDKNYIYLSLLNNGTFSFEGTDIPTIGGFDIIIVQFDIAGNYQWAFNAAYGTSNQTNGALAIDNSENIILAGGFLNDVTFLGGFSLTSPSASNQKFIAKFDSWGNLYWANKIDDDNTNTTIKSISTDANGYYFSGQFAGNFYLPTGTLTSNSTYREGFIYKTDMDGIGIWARKISAINNDLYINKHITDNSGNHYLAGYYNGVRLKIDSTSTDTSKINYLNTTSGTSDLVVLKYNTDGNLQWTKAIGSVKNEKAINLDFSNNKLLITGSYEGSVNFGIYNLSNSGGADAFIAECDLDGNFTNAINAAGTSNDIGQACTYSSTSRNYTVIGDFVSTNITIGTNQLINSLSGIRDAYVAKFGCFDSLHLSSTIICVDTEGLPISNDGTATATPSEGSEPYTYLWSNNETTPTITGLAAGTYSVTVSGANSCTAINSVIVSLSTDLAGTMNQNNITCSGGNDGYASISVSGGNAPYTYIWSNSETTSEINNLLPGTYYVTVTDQCGISLVDNTIITEPSPLEVNMSFTNLTCNGHGDDGTATATATFGNEPYTFAWSNDSTNASVTGLVAGTYYVSVTDKCGAMVVESVTISIPPVLITNVINRVNVTCFGLCNGSATADVTSGTSPYSYTWSTTPAQTDVNAINLCVGNYSVSVTDAAGCTSVSNFSISEPAILSGTMGQTNASCYGSCNGSAWITPSGGTAPISYLWNDAQTNDTIYSLCAGKYKVTITDFNNCVYNDSVDVIQPFTLAANISQTNVSCYGICNGTATSAPTGGDANYNYLWSTIPTNTTSSISSLCEGKYYLTVSDAYGCSVIDSVTITQPEALSGTLGHANASCYGYCNGSAWITPLGGTPPFNYLWEDAQTNDTILSLCAGKYKVTITDFNNCVFNDSADVIQPSVLTANITPTNVTCNSNCNGTATSTPTGGTAIYTYSWSTTPIENSNTASSLCAGKYYLTVTDASGCTVIDSVTIAEPEVLSAIISHTNPTNNNMFNGSVTVTPSGGTSPYTYLWNTTPSQSTSTINNLEAGLYKVTITDNNNCTFLDSVRLVPNTKLYGQFCNFTTGNLTTTIYCDAITNVEDYEYLFENSASGYSQTKQRGSSLNYISLSTIPGISYGKTYDVKVKAKIAGVWGEYGTTCQVTITSDEFNTKLYQQFCGYTTNSLSTAIYCDQVAFAEDYEYLFEHSPSGYSQTKQRGSNLNYIILNTIPNITIGKTYNVSVRAKVGGNWGAFGTICTVTITGPLTASTSQTDATCTGLCNGSATVWPSGGTLPFSYTYEWSTTPMQTTATAIDLCAGNYTVTVTDGFGNTITNDITITEPYTSITQINPCNGLCDGSATINTFGLISPFTYNWETLPVQNTVTATNLCTGTYQVTVEDGNGCILTNSATIVQPPILSVSSSQTNPTFNNTCNGSITAIPSGGTSPYTYLWSTTPAQTTVTISNNCAGNYTVTVTDNNNCTNTLTVLLIPNTKLYKQFCSFITSNMASYIYCESVTGAQDYEYWFEHAASGFSQTKLRGSSGNSLCLSWVPGLTSGKTYNVRVRAKVNGNWGDFGTTCTVTINSSKSLVVNEPEIEITADAFPNPFSSSSTVIVHSESNKQFELTLFDITGKIISKQYINSNEEIPVGEELITGIYFMVISGNDFNKTIKIVKTE